MSMSVNNVVEHFNSHAHVERDLVIVNILRCSRISTHTLTWSVTYRVVNSYLGIDISTHTLTWSVTFMKRLVKMYKCISTHTLTWSVTLESLAHNTD